MTEPEMINHLLGIVMKHERERPEFRASDYTDDEWNGLTEAIIYDLDRRRNDQSRQVAE